MSLFLRSALVSGTLFALYLISTSGGDKWLTYSIILRDMHVAQCVSVILHSQTARCFLIIMS